MDRSTFISFMLICALKPVVGQFMHGIVMKPTLQLNEDRIPFYSCQFNSEVDCLWKLGNQTISISVLNYTWIKGNGSRTTDCSIKGKSIDTSKLNINNFKQDVTCIGIVIRLDRDVELGGSIQLPCLLEKKANCDWKRDDKIIRIEGRYKFIQDHNGNNVLDCSIQIEDVQEIDLATWKCFNLATDDHEGQSSINAYYSLYTTKMEHQTSHKPEESLHNAPTEPTTKAVESPISPTNDSQMYQTGAESTSSNSDGKTSSSKADISATTPSTSKDDRRKENRMVAYLSSACAVIIVLIGVIIYLRKRQITNRRLSKTYSEQQLDMENNAAPDHEFADKVQGNEEHTYGNISKGQATPSALEYKREQPSLTQFGQPDADNRLTEIVYTEVVISLRNPVNSTNSLPTSQIERTTYATILPKTITEDIPQQ